MSVFVFFMKIAHKQENILGEALIVIVVMIIVMVIAMFVLMAMKMMNAKQTTILTVTAFDMTMMIQTVME